MNHDGTTTEGQRFHHGATEGTENDREVTANGKNGG